MPPSLESLLQDVVAKGASDLHLVHGYAPYMRLSSELIAMPHPPMDSNDIFNLFGPFLVEYQTKEFRNTGRLNVSFTIKALGRFRLNLCRAQGTVAASVRVIPTRIFPLSSLGLPPIVATLTQRTHGLIFITGPTGAGKSTTMAAMIDHINHTGPAQHVITIEDPIETLFKPDKCVFVQREVGVDLPSYETGIRDALRQDPDVLGIGEMRTADSMKGALTAAETGHLVLTTLHTPDAAKTAQRVVSVMAAEEQDIIRDQLCNALEAVISQELLPRADRKGLVVACEILQATPAVRRLIKEGKLEQIYDILHTGAAQGMVSKDASIRSLYQRKEITRETALAHMRSPELLGA